MIILSNTTDSLQVVLASAITTNQLRCYVAYRNTTATTITPNRAVANTNSTTPVTLLSAPASLSQKIVDYLVIHNADTVLSTVTVYINSSSTTYKLAEITLDVGERLEYQEGAGFRTLLSTGELKIGDNQGVSSISSTVNVASISSNVTNSNATYANITGLQFAMTAGETYWFRFCLFYTSNGTTRGPSFAVNSSAAVSYLSYLRIFHNNGNILFFPSRDYDAAGGATASVAGLTFSASMEGIITPSTSGNLIGRVASSNNGNLQTVRAGSLVYYQRLN